MKNSYYLDTDFEGLKEPFKVVNDVEYEHCFFSNCDFSEASFISCTFTDCTFKNCNLKMLKLDQSQLDNCSFKDCTLLGINFSACSDFLFSVSFEHCVGDYAVFHAKKMAKTPFIKSSFKEADFTECDLSQARFEETDLFGTTFKNTNLSGANFSTARNYRIDPEQNRLRKAKFSWPELQGLLSKYDLILN